MKIEQLFTRERSNKPERVEIGSEWIEVLGTDSDAFRKAKLEAQRKVVTKELSIDNYVAWLCAHLIVGWSFEDECSFDNAFELMKESPSLCEQVDKIASKRSNFMPPESKSLQRGAKSDSGSGNRSTQKTQKASRAKSTTKD